MEKFDNVISLGGYCFVASELKRLSMRFRSYPFDWIICDFKDVLKLINNHFTDFLDFNSFDCKQLPECYAVYNKKYEHLGFLHDFTGGDISVFEQLPTVEKKYQRRIERFYQTINTPTLFIRYIYNKKELKYIKNNKNKIKNFFKQFNKKNNIIYILNDDIKQSHWWRYFIPNNFYLVKRDKNYDASTKFVKTNKKLEKYLEKVKKNLKDEVCDAKS